MQTTTNEILKLLGPNYQSCESPSLRLEKFLHLDFAFDSNRSLQIAEVVKNSDKSKPIWREKSYPGAVRLVARLESNLIVNQAGGILENAGLCLDSLRGFPYVPGSAIKGVSLQAAWSEWRQSQDLALAMRIVAAFGFPTGKVDLDAALKRSHENFPEALSGRISFLTAKPLAIASNQYALTVDISTSHHPEYYQGKRAQAFDDENPIPLKFPAVAAGTWFVFSLVPLHGAAEQVCDDARRWLLQAISEIGLGAKTAAGYGWFSFDEQLSNELLQQEKNEAVKKQQVKDELQRQQRVREEQQRQEAENAKRRQEIKKRQATMSPEEILDEKINSMTMDQFRTRMGEFSLTGKRALSAEKKAALLRTLKGPRRDFWNEIKMAKRGKNTPNWPQIVNDVRALHRQLYDGEKMP